MAPAFFVCVGHQHLCMAELVLASRSPRRAALVRLLGLKNVRIEPADLHEEILPDISPAENTERLALDKARAIASSLTDRTSVVLGSDTIVVLDGYILGKPRDAEHAIEMLQSLSGRTHTVYTGVGLVSGDGCEESFHVETQVTFRTLNEREIEDYVATGAPMDKAGSYGIQEDFGAVFVSRIQGDYYNVVGLPLCELYQRLRRFEPALF